jgi:hypothetical protein
VEKYGTVRQATGDNIIRRRKEMIGMLGNKGKNTKTHSEYEIIFTFPLQQWLHERASMLCYASCLQPTHRHKVTTANTRPRATTVLPTAANKNRMQVKIITVN